MRAGAVALMVCSSVAGPGTYGSSEETDLWDGFECVSVMPDEKKFSEQEAIFLQNYGVIKPSLRVAPNSTELDGASKALCKEKLQGTLREMMLASQGFTGVHILSRLDREPDEIDHAMHLYFCRDGAPRLEVINIGDFIHEPMPDAKKLSEINQRILDEYSKIMGSLYLVEEQDPETGRDELVLDGASQELCENVFSRHMTDMIDLYNEGYTDLGHLKENLREVFCCCSDDYEKTDRAVYFYLLSRVDW
jgi:hypothetical protein